MTQQQTSPKVPRWCQHTLYDFEVFKALILSLFLVAVRLLGPLREDIIIGILLLALGDRCMRIHF